MLEETNPPELFKQYKTELETGVASNDSSEPADDLADEITTPSINDKGIQNEAEKASDTTVMVKTVANNSAT